MVDDVEEEEDTSVVFKSVMDVSNDDVKLVGDGRLSLLCTEATDSILYNS